MNRQTSQIWTCLLPSVLMKIALTGCTVINTFEQVSPTFEPWYPTVNEDSDPVFAVFESRIPCADCEKIKFALALYRNRETQAPTRYKMARFYVGKGNDRTINEGTWRITRGTKLDPQAMVYQLDSNAPEEFRSYWAIGQDIVFILDQELNSRVGDAGYGYVLNKTY